MEGLLLLEGLLLMACYRSSAQRTPAVTPRKERAQ